MLNVKNFKLIKRLLTLIGNHETRIATLEATPPGGVSSVFTRTGTVVADANDYKAFYAETPIVITGYFNSSAHSQLTGLGADDHSYYSSSAHGHVHNTLTGLGDNDHSYYEPSFVTGTTNQYLRGDKAWTQPTVCAAYIDPGTLKVGTYTMPSALRIGEAFYFASDLNLGTYSTVGTKTINWTKGNHQTFITATTTTLAFTNPTGPCNLQLRCIQDATGNRTIVFPTIKKPGGTAWVMSSAANAVDIISLYFDSATYFGQQAQGFA